MLELFGYVIIGVCLFLPAVVHPVMRILNAWWVDGTIRLWQALAWIALHTALLLLALKFLGWQAVVVYLIALNVYWIYEPRISRRRNREAIERMQDAEVARFTRLLAVEPQNPVYHSGLADALVERGRYAEAIPHYEQVVSLLPEEFTRDDQAKLRSARRLLEEIRQHAARKGHR